MKINLTKTQYQTLLKALTELVEIEGDEGCNDLEKDDKFYLLSKSEQKTAKKLNDNNFSASDYLYEVLNKQSNSE